MEGGKDMICPNCGIDSEKTVRFCTACGSPLPEQEERGTVPLIGYSSRIKDPAFARYRKHGTIWSLGFAAFLALAAIIGFYYYGETSGEMDNPQALYIGLGIGGMFLLIALLQILGRARSKTWDGVVIEKRREKKRRKRNSGTDAYWQSYEAFIITIKMDSGKRYELTYEDDDTVYNHYQIGDKVRHHKGLNTLEKYDKSKDCIIFCNACASLNDIEDDKCHRCSCPLLK